MNSNILPQPVQAFFPVASESTCSYDILFFTFNYQEQHPVPVKVALFQDKNFKQEEDELLPSFMLREPDPPGYSLKEKYPEDEATPDSSAEDFKPGYHFLHLIKARPFRCLMLVFDATSLEDLRNCWNKWTHCAVCASYSAFSENADRHYLLQFAQRFSLLMEALYFVVAQKQKGKKQQQFSPDFNTQNSGLQDPNLASKRIKDFVTCYPKKRPQDYIWSVFECAVADGEDFTIERRNLLFDYECLLCIAKAPYHLLKHYPMLFETHPDSKKDLRQTGE
ncbi:hypothetical protein A8C56_17475 [Niabella ginsenosidivorans]|uniref:Uncharacterized protein n=1 Tax=Niabella ginsenosidivorans TaxID=1176587 RepID=A0A1A9I5C1_9BACT|nr:hypothetical protein [Niabella ginsenosidivorans]ANH82525.1 hypothetical protein A8C56_17475 [Niabella ginsenosidivorans]